MAMDITLKTLVDSVKSGSIQKLVNDSGIFRATKLTLKPIWAQVLALTEEHNETLIELGDLYAQRVLSPTPMDPYREIFDFSKNPEAKKQYNDEEKALLERKVTITGNTLTLDDLKRVPWFTNPVTGLKEASPDPLSTDDYLKLEWLIPTMVEEVVPIIDTTEQNTEV